MLSELLELEESIGQLYEIYALRFKDYELFWRNLAKEKMEHANQIRKLSLSLETRPTQSEGDRRNQTLVRRLIDYVKKESSELSTTELPITNAFLIVLGIEEDVIESNCFKVNESDSDETISILTDLTNVTYDHIERVRKVSDDHLRLFRRYRFVP